MKDPGAKLQKLINEEVIIVDRSGPAVRYYPASGVPWSVLREFGICPQCCERGMSVGRCIDCGWKPEQNTNGELK